MNLFKSLQKVYPTTANGNFHLAKSQNLNIKHLVLHSKKACNKRANNCLNIFCETI